MKTFGGARDDAAEQERFRAGAAAALSLGATVVFGLGTGPAGLVVMLPAAALALHHGWREYRRRRRPYGDRLVAYLLENLSDDYCLAENVAVGWRRRVRRVLIGPSGALVIETRRTAGTVLCYGERWFVNGRRRRGFGRRVARAAAAVERALRARCPGESPALGRVRSLVVFTHPHCRLDTYRPRTLAVRYPDLLQVLRVLEKRCRLQPDTAQRLAQALVREPAEIPVPGSSLAAAG